MLTQAQISYIKSFIQGVYILNLPHRKDRLSNVCKELTKLDIGENEYNNGYLKYIEGIRFPNLHYISGRAGNSAAMCKALTLAYEAGLDNFLLLEDDVFFVDNRLRAIYEALQDIKNINWDILFLGGRIKSKMTNFSNGLYRIHTFGCNQSTLYNKKVIRYLLSLLPKWDACHEVWVNWVARNECFDIWQSNVLGQNSDFYCFSPKELCTLQIANFSDINQKDSDGIKILEEDFERNKL